MGDPLPPHVDEMEARRLRDETRQARPIVTAAEYALIHEAEADAVQRWAREGLLPGAYKSPNTARGTWLIPRDCPRPVLRPGPVGGALYPLTLSGNCRTIISGKGEATNPSPRLGDEDDEDREGSRTHLGTPPTPRRGLPERLRGSGQRHPEEGVHPPHHPARVPGRMVRRNPRGAE